MSTDDIIIGLYVRVDTIMADQPKHPQAELYPSELVTLGLLFALKGVGPRRFYRWLRDNYHAWFPRLPERTRLFRVLAAHQDWTEAFLAQPTPLGVADTYGIELRHPWREDRADGQIGGKGLSNHRWIVGAKLGYVVNQYGLIVAWDTASANVADNAFRALVADFVDDMVIFTDMAFHASRGRPAQSESVQARHVEWPHGRRSGAVAADAGRRAQEAEPPHLAQPGSAAGLYHGAVQCAGPVGRIAG